MYSENMYTLIEILNTGLIRFPSLFTKYVYHNLIWITLEKAMGDTQYQFMTGPIKKLEYTLSVC